MNNSLSEYVTRFLLERNRQYLGLYIKSRYTKVMHKVSSRTLELQDLVQEAFHCIYNRDLLERWEPKGQSVTTWLIQGIDQHLFKHIAEQGGHLKIPIIKFREDMALIYSNVGQDEDKIIEATQRVSPELFDISVLESKSHMLWACFKNSINYNSITTKCFNSKIDNKLTIDTLMENLNSKQKALIIYWYYYELGTGVIGDIFNVTRQRVHQIRDGALLKMRQAYEERYDRQIPSA